MIKIESHTKDAPNMIHHTAKRKIKNLLRMLNDTRSDTARTYFEERVKLWRSK